jgi:flagellar biosynthesis anti-sigma factor FlgM
MDLRIPGSEINTISKTYKTAAAKTSPTATGNSGASGAADSVVLSPDAEQALDVTKAAETKAKELPDVRDEVVEPLQAQVQNGQYQVEPAKVAAGMLAELTGGGGDE